MLIVECCHSCGHSFKYLRARKGVFVFGLLSPQIPGVVRRRAGFRLSQSQICGFFIYPQAKNLKGGVTCHI